MSPAKRADGPTQTCPWCSAVVASTATTCPACGASLRDAADGDVLGVTTVDPTAHHRALRRKPRRIAAWLAGEQGSDDESAIPVTPPSEAVRREMLRLELAAIDAEIEAKRSQAEAAAKLPAEDAKGT